MRLRRFVVSLVTVALVAGCDTSPIDPNDMDGGEDDAGGSDGGTDEVCTSHDECSDGTFCNGPERCVPGDPAADARGCAPPESGPCMPTQTCDEDEDRCLTECDIEPDADGDGRDSIECGGDDCDDADANRYTGNLEVCDADDHDEDCDPRTFGVRDLDGDGFIDSLCCNVSSAGERICGDDCADTRATVHPTATEACDGVDNDCNGMIDEGVLQTFYEDADGDMRGSADPAAPTMMACFPPPGFVASNDDCDDTRSSVHPATPEVCDAAMLDENCDGDANPEELCSCSGDISRACALPGACAAGTERCVDGGWGACSIAPVAEICNGVDDDCDGSTDELLLVTCFDDPDDDGYAVVGAAMTQVCPVSGRGAVGGCPTGLTNREPLGANIDCDDTRNDVRPGGTEVCDAARADEDCDGLANPDPPCACSGSETRACPLPGRCAGGTQTCAAGAWGACSISPGAEICNGIDDNCDGSVDEALTVVCYDDADDDGYAPMSAAGSDHCPVSGRGAVGGCPFGFTNRAPLAIDSTDCNDAVNGVHPGAAEVCDAARVDEDCDGIANPDPPCACSGSETRSCPQPGRCAAGTQTCASGAWGPCSISPDTEVCNGIDDDCDGVVDDGVTVTCYTDEDNDTYSPGGAPMSVCPAPGRGSVGGCPVGLTNRAPGSGTTDCDDAASAIYPTAPESCVGSVDDDCDGAVNEGCTCTIGEPSRPCQRLGVCAGGTETCSGSPPAWICDVAPTAESCNGLDDDCDGTTDEGTTVQCWVDNDRDSYAAAGASSSFLCSCPLGTTPRDPSVAGNADCDDSNDTRYPGRAESCNGVDDDCDGTADEGIPVVTVYVDSDGDGYRGTPQSRCAAPGDSTVSEDCDEARTDTYVGAPEICDRFDNNCSSGGGVDTSEDVDNDGHASPANACTGGMPKDDCNDSDAATYPGATEVVGDGVDQSCDGAEICYLDNDNDGYRPNATATVPSTDADCGDPGEALGSEPTGDCNDSLSSVHPGATEVADNGLDDNCNGTWGCFRDQDSDGFRPVSGGTTVYDTSADSDCNDAGEGRTVEPTTDCDDTNALVNPGRTEIADNGLDDNCSGAHGCYYDADNDGYSRSDAAIRDDSADADCLDSGEGRSTEPRTDCDDTNANVNPGRTELADNGLDDDCDGYWGCYRDADSDGYRPTSGGSTVYDTSTDSDCNDAGEGTGSEPATDCLDTNNLVNPGRPELADNGLDDNCSGRHGCYYDADNDGHSRSDGAIRDDSLDSDCLDSGEGRSSEPRDDCNDGNDTIYDGAPEWCDSVDQDCDGSPTNACPSTVESYGSLSYSSYYGGTGGTAFTTSCSSNQVLVGLRVYHDGTFVNAIQPICAAVTIEQAPGSPNYVYYATPGSVSSGMWSGSFTGSLATLMCPTDTNGRLRIVHEITGRSGALVDAIGVRCGGYRWSSTTMPPPFTTVRWTQALVSPVGGSGGGSFTYTCPSEAHVGTAIRGRAGARLDAISLGCRSLDYVPQ